MEPKCTCGVDSSFLTSKQQYITNDSRYVRIIYCSKCGKIHGILENKNISDILEKLERKIK